MSNKDSITIDQTDETRDGKAASVLRIKGQELGYVVEDANRFIAYAAGQTTGSRFKTAEDATTFLISEYHLHLH